MQVENSLAYSQESLIVRILCQLDAVQILTSYFSNIHFDIILFCTPRSREWSLHLFWL